MYVGTHTHIHIKISKPWGGKRKREIPPFIWTRMGRPGLHWKRDVSKVRNEWPSLSPQLWYISSSGDRLVNLSNVAFAKKTNTVDKCEGPTTFPPIGSLATWAILPSKENSPLYLQGKSFWLILQGFAHSKLTVSPCCTVNGWRGKCFPSHHVETTSQKGGGVRDFIFLILH